MGDRSATSGCKDVVYGEVNENLVFIPRARAVELATIQVALWSSSTWGELRSRIPAEAYEELLERSGGNELLDFDEFYREARKTKPTLTRQEATQEYRALSTDERRPEPDDPFRAGSIGAISDGGFPGWPQQEMLRWVPKDIRQRFGSGSFSFVSGDCLVFEVDNESEIVEAFERHGYRCERDDSLVLQASGYGG